MAISYADRAKSATLKTQGRVIQPSTTSKSLESSTPVNLSQVSRSIPLEVELASKSSGPVTSLGEPPAAPHQHNLIHHRPTDASTTTTTAEPDTESTDQPRDLILDSASSSQSSQPSATGTSFSSTSTSPTNAWAVHNDAHPARSTHISSSIFNATVSPSNEMSTQSESRPVASTHSPRKRKPVTKSTPNHQPSSSIASNSTVIPPSFNEASNWPAPSEVAVVPTSSPTPNPNPALPINPNPDDPTSTPNQTKEDQGLGAGLDPIASGLHSRDSSTMTSSTSHGGKKQQWIRIPASELVPTPTTNSTRSNSPHYHPRGGDRRNGPRITPGGRNSSGYNSKRSSTAASPAQPPLSHLPNTLNANAVPFVGHRSPQPPFQVQPPYGYTPGVYSPFQRSHPHSPLAQGGRSPFPSSHPQSLLNSPRASNPPPPPKKKVPRPSPSKSGAVGGDIPQLSPGFRPTFGSVSSDAGLGLSTGMQELNLSDDNSHSDGAIRWEEADRTRIPTKAELVMRAEGRYGIGVAPEEMATRARRQNATDSSAVVTPAEEPSVPPTPGLASMRSPKHKWSFGSLDKAFASGDPSAIDPLRQNGMTNGMDYPGSSLMEGRGRSYSPSGEGGHNGYPRRGVRRLSRGGYGRGGGPYANGPRAPMGGGYRNGAPYAPPPPQPMYTGYMPPYDPYGPPPPVMPYPNGSEYTQPDPYSPQTPTEYPAVPMPYYPYPPPGYPPPMPYYPGYMPQNGMLYGPVPPSFPPPMGVPYTAGPPVPTPVTPVGYIDPLQYSLLGQLEYYFSPQNMSHDAFLKKNMDGQGWIDLNVIASFNRVRSLTGDANVLLVRDVLRMSAVVELSPEGDRCRMANGQWQNFLVSAVDEPSAVPTDGEIVSEHARDVLVSP